jgi:hypothetical protein
MSKDTGLVIKNFPIKSSPESNGFTGKFYQTLKKEVTTIFLKLFPKN